MPSRTRDDLRQLLDLCAASAQPLSRDDIAKLQLIEGVTNAERAEFVDSIHAGSIEIALLKQDGNHNLARRRCKELAEEWAPLVDENYRPDDGISEDAGPREIAAALAARRHPGLL